MTTLSYFETGDGSEYLYPGLLRFRDLADQIVRSIQPEAGLTELVGNNAFVFSHYLGEQALLFRIADGDDPAVLRLSQGNRSLNQASSAFSQFVLDMLTKRKKHRAHNGLA